jgi:hypothetical protein
MLNKIGLQIVTGIFLVMFYMKSITQIDYLCLLGFPFFFTLKKNKEINIYNIYSFIFLLVLAACSLIITAIPFIIALLGSLFFLIQPLALFFNNPKFYSFFYDLVKIFDYYQINNYLYQFYKFFIEHKNYKIHVIILNLFIILYIFTSRYYFINKNIPLYFYLFLFVGFFCLYLRFAVIFYVYINNCILYFENEPNPDQNTFLKINYKSHNSSTYHPIPPEKFTFFKRIGLLTAVITCGAACGTLYYTAEQARYAAEQARYAAEQARYAAEQAQHAAEQNVQIQQQNDLEAFSQNLITKEQFCEYQPRYCTKTNVQELAEKMAASKKAGMLGIKSTSNT